MTRIIFLPEFPHTKFPEWGFFPWHFLIYRTYEPNLVQLIQRGKVGTNIMDVISIDGIIIFFEKNFALCFEFAFADAKTKASQHFIAVSKRYAVFEFFIGILSRRAHTSIKAGRKKKGEGQILSYSVDC